jgi:hypothetical protein
VTLYLAKAPESAASMLVVRHIFLNPLQPLSEGWPIERIGPRRRTP